MPGLADVDLRHLVALRAVADEGTFGRAAARLGFSQAAVSQQVAALERAVGQRLFDRPGGPRPVELTPAGRLMLTHAIAVLDRVALAEQDLRDLQSGTHGRLTVGTFQSVSVRLLPRLVHRMREVAPGVDIWLEEVDEQRVLLERLLDGHLDVSFLVGRVDEPRVEVVPLRSDPFVVLLPRLAEDGAEGDPPSPYPTAALAGVPMVGEHPSSCRALIDDGLRAQGIEATYQFRTNDNGTVQAMVRAGMGPAIMPLLAVDVHDPGVSIRPLDPPVPPRPIGIGVRRGSVAPAARRFVDLAVEVSAALTVDLPAAAAATVG